MQPLTCFYCNREVEENDLHLISFVSMNKEQEQILCSQCYAEWLEGTKG